MAKNFEKLIFGGLHEKHFNCLFSCYDTDLIENILKLFYSFMCIFCHHNIFIESLRNKVGGIHSDKD
jgi:hypothetical protein